MNYKGKPFELVKLEESYTVRFRPGQFFVVPGFSTGPAGDFKYFNVVDDKSGMGIAFTPDQNNANTVCLALELLTATVMGDQTRLRELVKLIDKLKKGDVLQ